MKELIYLLGNRQKVFHTVFITVTTHHGECKMTILKLFQADLHFFLLQTTDGYFSIANPVILPKSWFLTVFFNSMYTTAMEWSYFVCNCWHFAASCTRKATFPNRKSDGTSTCPKIPFWPHQREIWNSTSLLICP